MQYFTVPHSRAVLKSLDYSDIIEAIDAKILVNK
jgi:hypothetical protein